MSVSRRKFLSTGLVLGAGLILPGVSLPAKQAFNIIGANFVPVDPHSLALLQKILSASQKWPTAQACLICRQPVENIGGQKLIRTKLRGTALLHQADSNRYPGVRAWESLFGSCDLYFTVWGEESIFTDQIVAKARREYLNGMQPWFCQKCGKRSCHLCGEPLNVLAYGDYAFAEGGRGFYGQGPNLGANPGCINPRCRSYRNMNKCLQPQEEER